MSRIMNASMAALWVSAVLCVWAAGKQEAPSLEEQEVLQAEKARVDALLAGDVQALDRMWHPDFRQIASNGAIRNKGHRMAAFRAGSVKYSSIRQQDVEVRVFDHTAIVTGLSERKGQDGNRKVNGMCRFSRVWVKQDGRWQLVQSDFARFDEK